MPQPLDLNRESVGRMVAICGPPLEPSLPNSLPEFPELPALAEPVLESFSLTQLHSVPPTVR